MNEWVIIFGVVAAIVIAIVMVALDWVGWKSPLGGMSVGIIIGMIIWVITKNPIVLFIAVAVGIVLGIGWHFIVRLAVGRG